jgi:hypothetical protein
VGKGRGRGKHFENTWNLYVCNTLKSLNNLKGHFKTSIISICYNFSKFLCPLSSFAARRREGDRRKK